MTLANGLLPHFALLLLRRWRILFTGVLLVVVLVGGSFLLLGAQTFLHYLQIIRLYGTQSAWTNTLEAMHKLRALTGVWLPAPWGIIAWLSASALVFIGVVCLNLRLKQQPNGFEIRWIGNSIALLLLSPHLFTHDLCILVVPCALLLSIGKARVPIWLGTGLVAIALLPAANYVLPTIMGFTLAALFELSLAYARTKFAGDHVAVA